MKSLNPCFQCSILITCDKAPIADSLHKTFTNCYYAAGFVGGYWATALNNDRKNYYYLGWETREVSKKCYITPRCVLHTSRID